MTVKINNKPTVQGALVRITNRADRVKMDYKTCLSAKSTRRKNLCREQLKESMILYLYRQKWSTDV